MLVVVDANVIIKDPLLRDRKWQVARDAISADRLRLVMPDVARLEAVGGYRRDRQEKVRQVKSIIRQSTDRAKAAAEGLIQVYLEESNNYESILDDRLREVGFEIPGPSERTHLEIAERAVNRLPPFDESGGGYRDTLLWLTALEQIAEPPFDNLILVSDDGVFTKRMSALAEELQRETAAELTVVRSIGNVEFPGEYETGDFDLSSIDVDTSEIVKMIKDGLPGMDITRWSPPGPDHAEVQQVDRVDLLAGTIDVRKRYGSSVYEVSADAIADIDARVLVIHDSYGQDVDFSEMSARWDLHVRWRGETEGERTRLSEESTVEVIGLDERRSPGR